MRAHALLRLTGIVQGVNLRTAIKQRAANLSIVGYVKNSPDGSVEVVAEGEQQNVKELIAWIKSSPGASHIENVETQWVNPGDAY